jgi:hypothetical protein
VPLRSIKWGVSDYKKPARQARIATFEEIVVGEGTFPNKCGKIPESGNVFALKKAFVVAAYLRNR